MATQPDLFSTTGDSTANPSAAVGLKPIAVDAPIASVAFATVGGEQTAQPNSPSIQTASDDTNNADNDSSSTSAPDGSSDSSQNSFTAIGAAVRHESVIRLTASTQPAAQSSTTACFLTSSTQHSFNQNPFSKTTGTAGAVGQQSVSTTTGAPNAGSSTPASGAVGAAATADPSADSRSTVILAPARLALSTGSTASAPNTSNNYFSNNFTQNSSAISADSRLSSTAATAAAANKSLLRPSVLRVADSSTNNSQNAQNSAKVFAFVSLSKEDISRPATTLLQSDSIIRCGADTTSPYNGEEATFYAQTSTTGSTGTAVTSTSSASAGSGDVQTTSACIEDPEDSDSQTGFVFGQNLEERAVFVNQSKHKLAENRDNSSKRSRTDDPSGADTSGAVDGDHNGAVGGQASTSSGDTVPIKPNSDGVLDLSSTGSADNSPEKDTNNKRKHEVITGEEDEQNVLSMHCRLYAWATDTSTWIERGRGCLRLNDVIKDEKLCSRIVMRTSGALRVILNAHLLSGMRFDLSNEHCLRFTNVDGIYLIKGAPKDIDQLNSAIEYRLREISKRCKTSGESAVDSSPEPQHQTLEDMSNDGWNQTISTKE